MNITRLDSNLTHFNHSSRSCTLARVLLTCKHYVYATNNDVHTKRRIVLSSHKNKTSKRGIRDDITSAESYGFAANNNH